MLRTIVNWLFGVKSVASVEKERIVVNRNTVYNTMTNVDEAIDKGKGSLTLKYDSGLLWIILGSDGGTEFSVIMSSSDAAMFINVMELNRQYSLPQSYVTPFVNGLLNTLRERGLITISKGYYDTTIEVCNGVELNIVR